jgi:hypothetical protein
VSILLDNSVCRLVWMNSVTKMKPFSILLEFLYILTLTHAVLWMLCFELLTYRRNLNVVWQQYPFGSTIVPPYNWDYYSWSPYIEYEVNELQKVLITPSFMNPDP